MRTAPPCARFSVEDENRLRREAGWSPAPRGVFCPRVNVYQRRLPEIPNQFSVKIETVDEVSLSPMLITLNASRKFSTLR